MEKPNSQLKDCFDGYFQEAVEMSFEQDESKMPFLPLTFSSVYCSYREATQDGEKKKSYLWIFDIPRPEHRKQNVTLSCSLFFSAFVTFCSSWKNPFRQMPHVWISSYLYSSVTIVFILKITYPRQAEVVNLRFILLYSKRLIPCLSS